MGHLSSKHIVNLVLVRVKCKEQNKKADNRRLPQAPTYWGFIHSESAETDNEGEEDDEVNFNPKFVNNKKRDKMLNLKEKKN